MSRHLDALRRAAEGEIVEPVKVTAQFASDFELVATHYNLRQLGEYDAARNAARNDIENAMPTYAALAEEIRKEQA